MIILNNVELTDAQYRDRLHKILDELLIKFEEDEDYEMCTCCLDMRKNIPTQSTESVKNAVVRFTALMGILRLTLEKF